MKIKLPICWQRLLAAFGCVFLTGGCGSTQSHRAYATIHQCAINGDSAGVAAELAKSRRQLNLPEDGGLTPLHLAAENCHTNVVLLLLNQGAKINIQTDDKATPLHLAAQEGCEEVVKLLLAKGAKINSRDSQQHTPLGRAELWHQAKIVLLLQRNGGTE